MRTYITKAAVAALALSGAVTAATVPVEVRESTPEPVYKRITAFGAGLNIAQLVRAIKNFLKDKNAYDPDVPDKCVIITGTSSGGHCNTKVQCGSGAFAADQMPDWNVCYLHGRQYFNHPDIGDFSITFSKAGGKEGNDEDGLHHPIFQFAALNDWEEMDVQAIIDSQKDFPHGKLCKRQDQAALQSLGWHCGIPKLTRSASSAFGIDLVNPDTKKDGYKKGWCTAHAIQYQRNEYGNGGNYAFTYQIFDADGDQIGHVQHQPTDDSGHLDITSKLPYTVSIKAGKSDEEPVEFCYADQCWKCDKPNDGGGDHQCTLGKGPENGYENGDRKGDMGFDC